MGKHLSLSDRAFIERCLVHDYTFAAIARKLNRSPTTVSREIKDIVYSLIRKSPIRMIVQNTRAVYAVIFAAEKRIILVFRDASNVMIMIAGKYVNHIYLKSAHY